MALGVLITAALAAQVTSRRVSRLSPLMAVIAFAALLTALQLVPLPSGLSTALDPEGQALLADGRELLHTGSSWAPLSRDPAGTRQGLVLLVLLGGAAFVALRVAASERGRLALVSAVAAVGALAAVVTAGHELTGATSLYGVYRPQFATPVLLGPLLNPNHLGCLFALAAVAAGGLAFHAAQPAALRWVWALCAVATAGGALLTQSRGSAVALLAGAVVCGGTLLGQRMRGRADQAPPPRLTLNAIAIGVVALCVLALVVFASGRSVSDQLRSTRTDEWSEPGSKYAAWRSSMLLVAESPWLGIGRGAFESSFTRVHPTAGRVTFSHPENEYVQAVVEWGLPGALLLAALVGWLAVSAARRWRMGALTSAALGACAVIAVQSVVDFGLELPGLAIPAVALLATLVQVPLRELAQPQRRRAAVLRGVATAVMLLATALLGTSGTRLLREDHAALVATRPPQEDGARPALARHPHDYLAFAHLGEALQRAGDPRARLYFNHALRLHPTHPGLHRAVGRLLWARGLTRQAALQYATALRNTSSVAPLLQEVVRVFPDPEIAATAIPVDYPVPEHVARVLVSAKAPKVALRWLHLVAEQRPGAPRVGELLYTAAMREGELELAERGARLRYQQDPTAQALLVLGRLLVKRERLDDAAEVLEASLDMAGAPEDLAAARLLFCDVEISRQRWPSARACLQALRDSPYAGKLLLELARRSASVDAASAAAAAPAKDGASPAPAPR